MRYFHTDHFGVNYYAANYWAGGADQESTGDYSEWYMMGHYFPMHRWMRRYPTRRREKS